MIKCSVKKSPEEKLVEKQAKLESDLTEEDDVFSRDPLLLLRRLYGSRIDTIPGCLEIMESLVRLNNCSIPNDENYSNLYKRFRRLLIDEKRQGLEKKKKVNIRPFLSQYVQLKKLKPQYELGDFSTEDGDNEPFSLDDLGKETKEVLSKQQLRKGGEKTTFLPSVYGYNPLSGWYAVR